jgi:hypothetical protein
MGQGPFDAARHEVPLCSSGTNRVQQFAPVQIIKRALHRHASMRRRTALCVAAPLFIRRFQLLAGALMLPLPKTTYIPR